MDSAPTSAKLSANVSDTDIGIRHLPFLAKRTRGAEVAKVRNCIPNNRIVVETTADRAGPALASQTCDGIVGIVLVQGIIGAVDVIVSGRQVLSFSIVDAFAKEGVSGVSRGVIADFVDAIGVVGWDSEASSDNRGNEERRELQETHVEGLGAASCSIVQK
jgi:hypothetical protein